MSTRTIPLRILYTINSSPQYILARSQSLIPVVPVLYNESHNRNDNQISSGYDKDGVSTARPLEQPPIYANTSLKMCLDTICRSSPEIVQDNSRDFSVYVLDPLESNSAPAPVRIADSNSCSGVPSSPTTQTPNSTPDQPRGVAVGLGLMSWALLADERDSVTVSGTLIRLGSGQEALEVIFALRETAPMQKASLPAAVRSWGLPPEPSKRTRVHASKCHRESKHPSSNPTANTNTNSIPQQHLLSHSSSGGSSNPARPASQQSNLRSQDQGVVYSQQNALPLCSSSAVVNANPASYDASASASTSTSTTSPGTPFSAFNPISAFSSSRPSSTLPTINTGSNSRQPKPKPKPKTARPPSEVEKLLDASAMYLGPPKRKGRPKVYRSGVVIRNGETENASEATLNRNVVSSGSDLAHNGDKDRDEIMVETMMSGDGAVSTDFGSVNGLGTPSNAGSADSTAAKRTSTSKAKSKKEPKLTNDDQLNPPFVSTPLIRQPADSNPIPSSTSTDKTTLLDVLAALSASTSSNEPSTQNAALLAALNSIDSVPGITGSSSAADGNAKGESNPALVNALRQLLSACSRRIPPSSENQRPYSHQQNPIQSLPHLQDDEIVLLDKENVNPTAFRRRAERERANAKLLGLSLPFSATSGSLESGNAAAGRTVTSASGGLGISMRSNGNTSVPVPSFSSPDLNIYTRRKRRLSDFMDERESGRDGQRNREKAGKRDAHRHTRRNSSENAVRHQSHSRREKGARHHRTGMESWTSPPRLDNGNSRGHFISVPESTRAPQVSASSPVRSSFVQSQSRKRYVVPEWARTNTATQPRLSKEAERAMVEAEERKKEEKEAGKKRAVAAAHAKETERGRGKNCDTRTGQSDTRNQNHASKGGSISFMPHPPPKPIAASGGFPVFGAADASSSLPAPSSSISRSPSRSPSLAITETALPTTPPPNRRADASSTLGVEGSLFTPTPTRWSDRGLNDVGGPASSPLFSPMGGLNSVSPLRSGQKTKLSPIQAVVMGRSIVSGDAGWAGCGRTGKERQAESQGGESDRQGPDVHDLEDMLSRELGSAFEDLDFPPSSLPTASSDIDIDTYPSHTSCDESSGDPDVGRDSDQENGHTMKQHWSGLPPSSPPPPTSPLLMPRDAEADPELPTDDEEIDDLNSEFPLATSDTAYGCLDPKLTPDSANAELVPYSADELAMYFDMNDFSTLSSTPSQPCSDSLDHQGKPSSEIDVFELFTNYHAQSGDLQTQENIDASMDQGHDPVIQNGLLDFDYTEFWESMKPLVESTVNVDTISDSHADFGLDFGMPTRGSQEVGISDLDHTKLAEEVHALFSGCLM